MEKNKIKVLLVDDDENVRSMYAEIFRNNGLEVVEAKDGLEGLDMATKQNPNVILSGIIMPRMDGFALKEALVKNVATSSIPFMILSHMGRQEDKTKAESLGVKDFFVFGMITPLEIVKKIKIESGSKEYTLQLNTELLDASKLVNDFKLGENLKCPKCSKDLNLKLKVADVSRREFLAKLICPNCDAS